MELRQVEDKGLVILSDVGILDRRTIYLALAVPERFLKEMQSGNYAVALEQSRAFLKDMCRRCGDSSKENKD